MKLTPLQKRAARQARNQSQLDLNLVSLIDIFTILIFFLLSSAAGVEISGLGAPMRADMPIFERARSVRLAGRTLPAAVSASSDSRDRMMRSAGSPRFRRSGMESGAPPEDAP